MDIPDIASLTSALSQAINIANGLRPKGSDDNTAELMEALNSMASTAVSVDSACLSLQRRVNDLEQENKALKDWSEEAKKYEPKSLRGIATVYVKKSTAKDDEDPYWLCSNCFVKGEMSIIQKEANLADVSFHLDADSWICNSCKGKYGIPKHLTPLV